MNFHIVGVEDFEGYHGKALGEIGKSAVEQMKKSITSAPWRPHGLGPQPVVDDAPAIDLLAKLSNPPSYTIGEKVNKTKRGGGGVHLFKALVKLNHHMEKIYNIIYVNVIDINVFHFLNFLMEYSSSSRHCNTGVLVYIAFLVTSLQFKKVWGKGGGVYSRGRLFAILAEGWVLIRAWVLI